MSEIVNRIKYAMSLRTPQEEALSYFDAISDGVGLVHPKPDPEVFLKAAKRLNLRPDQCAVIEDAKAGIDAANKGNFTSIAFNGEAYGHDKADYHIKNFSELIKIAERSFPSR